MIKGIITLVLAGMLALATGCSKEEKPVGIWEDIAMEEMAEDEATKNQIPEMKELKLYPFLDEESALFGYMNSKGETVIEPQFEKAEDFDYITRMARVFDENENMNYIDEKGQLILKEFSHKWVNYPIAGLISFSDEEGYCGVMDVDGNIILPHEYELINIQKDGYMFFSYNDKYGVANSQGEIIIEPVYDHVFGDSSGIIISNEDKYGIYDEGGNEVFPIIYEEINFVTKDLITLKDHSGKYGMYNYDGQQITDHIYDEINGYGRTLIQVSKDGKWGYINDQGEVVVDIEYEGMTITMDPRFAQVEVDGKQGIMDMYGKWLVEPKYDYVSFGYDDDMKLIDDCFIVRNEETSSLIDKNGKVLREEIDSGLMIYEDYIFGSNEEYQYILLDLKGNELGKYKYFINGGEYMLFKDSEEETDGYVVDLYTGQVVSTERYENMDTYLQYNRIVASKGENIYIMDENLEVLFELRASQTGIWIRDVEIYGEDLIKIIDDIGGIKWLNSKGERIK